MRQSLLVLLLTLFSFQQLLAKEDFLSLLGSREGDPSSIVENVSTIHGDYSESEIDLIVSGPDSLILSRFYSSRDSLFTVSLGGWRFYPHCFLTVQKDFKGKTYTTEEGKFDRTYAYLGTSEGSVLTYLGWKNNSNPQVRSLFKVDVEEKLLGVTNSARGTTNAWTNLKNNELYFSLHDDTFELFLSNGGWRFYVKHPSRDFYALERETLPSGNKIFYEYDDQSYPVLVKMTNSSEKKVLGWIKIQYGNSIHVDSSDGQSVDYLLEPGSSGKLLLTKVLRSNKPPIAYQYRIVDERALLLRKDLPEGRFTEIDYYTDKTHQNKVKSVATPAGGDGSGSLITQFVYEFEKGGSGSTGIYGPLNRKTVHRFNEDLQLVSIEQYLGGSLYRVQKRSWGKKRDATNLVGTTIEDGTGKIYYAKTLSYDEKGNVLQEREYGNLTGANPHPIEIDEEGNPETSQESHGKTYAYHTVNKFDVVNQKDAKGSGIRFVYKKGTNLILRKYLFEKNVRKKRWFYDYNEDGSLTRIIVDDGETADVNSTYDIQERHITQITPKEEMPHIGAPEVIEEKYFDPNGEREVLLKMIINHFDDQGNITAQDVYDANGKHRYTLKKIYENGLLKKGSDPAGNETTYSYDKNQNLVSEVNSAKETSFEYRYDLKNRLVYTAEKDANGKVFETRTSYDPVDYKRSETDRFGNETIYHFDDLGRIQSVVYPAVRDEKNSSLKPTYLCQYDLFDHVTSVTDPRGETTLKAYTLRGQPTKVQYPDGTQELFKYDAEGSLHRYLSKNGTVRIFEYDYCGRLDHIEHYGRSHQESGKWLSSVRYSYDAFRVISEEDEEGDTTTYAYDGTGRLVSLKKGSRKVEFFYDSLGRTNAVKKWKTASTFTLEIRKYDLLDKVVEEFVEDSKGNILLKHKYLYDKAGLLQEVIGYPQNQESTLKKYEYDGVGRLIAIKNAVNQITKIIYDDAYINEWGQRVLKRTEIDPLGNQKEEIFDPAGHLAKVTKKNKQGQILAESEFIYDAVGNELVERNTVLFSGERLRTYATEQTYGLNNYLKAITQASNSPEESTASFNYNSFGDLATKYNPGAKTPIIYRYDDDGKLKSIRFQEGEAEEITHKLSYDKKGNVTEVKLGLTHTLIHEFDPNNQLISETIRDEFGFYQVSYTFDGEGMIQSIRLPDGSFIEYDYAGPLVKGISRCTKDKKKVYSHRITARDLMGNVLEEIFIGHAGARTQKWDQAGRKIGISTDFFQDKIPEGGFDPLQNIRKREVSLDDEQYAVDYEYDELSHLISEKGRAEHTYSFDSLGNRLKKDGSSYKVNNLNQVLEANGVIYTFDAKGALASKTVEGKTWLFQHNAFNKLVSVKDPDQTNISFTYDLSGKRLSKKIEGKGKKAKVLRYFYIGQTEIGCLDEKGVILELRIPGNSNNPEAAPFIAFEIKKDPYVPIYDLQGNIVCLVDPESRNVVERYGYSAFGEEKITNQRGRGVSDSSVGNPWRYRGKRIDKDIGLISFGHRYYDPELGRWMSPDPAGSIDGPNFYAFCHNNPLSYVDYFGLAAEANNNGSVDEKYFYGEYEPHCFCERHRDCKRGGDVARALGHGAANLFFNSRVQGAIQAFGGFGEAFLGGQMTLATSGVAAPLGWAVMAHGLDQFITGVKTTFTGRTRDTLTSQLLQKRGVPHQTVTLIDGGLSLGGSLGAGYVIQSSRALAFSYSAAVEANGNFYSVAFETELSTSSYPGISRARHFQEANSILLNSMEESAQFSEMMQKLGINLERTATGLAPRTPPVGWTWHHSTETGVMQLVPRAQHTPGSIFWDTLHPGGQGGYSTWGQQ